MDFPRLVSEIKEFTALVSIAPKSLAVLGIAYAAVAKENPDPNKSKNIALPNCVILFWLSYVDKSLLSLFGPIPATLIYWEERPGAPTAIKSGFEARLSALVSPSIP